MNFLYFIILLVSFQNFLESIPVSDFSKVYHENIDSVCWPKTIAELASLVKNARKPVSIAGAQYSMGGQVWFKDGIMIHMAHLCAITAFNPEDKTITVQAGAVWRDVQAFLLKHNLTIKVMQSYNDFSIGGSLSVNVHGRDPHGQIIHTVNSLRVMLSDGSIVTASKKENSDLFNAVIGGYGSCGICIDATFSLENNHKIELKKETLSIDEFADFYIKNIKDNPNISLFNANIYAPDFNQIISSSWIKTNEPLTVESLVQKNKSGKPVALKKMINHSLEHMVSEYALAQKIRFFFENNFYSKSKSVVWRSYEMSYEVGSLAPSTEKTSKILQEYFIPIHAFSAFLSTLKKVFIHNQVKVLNISIRHVQQDKESFLSYAPKESFAFVCYISIDNNKKGHEKAALWTQEIIDAALSCEGTYYLPYHLFARPDQYLKAYPRYKELMVVKQKYDPEAKFKNSLTDLLQKSYKKISA